MAWPGGRRGRLGGAVPEGRDPEASGGISDDVDEPASGRSEIRSIDAVGGARLRDAGGAGDHGGDVAGDL